MITLTILAVVFGICGVIVTGCIPFVVLRDWRLQKHGVTTPTFVPRF